MNNIVAIDKYVMKEGDIRYLFGAYKVKILKVISLDEFEGFYASVSNEGMREEWAPEISDLPCREQWLHVKMEKHTFTEPVKV